MDLNFSVGDVVQVIATLFVGYEIFRVARETKIQRVLSSRTETLNALATYSDDLKGLNAWLRQGDNDELVKSLEILKPPHREVIVRYLAACERLAVGVRFGVYDMEILKHAISKSLRRNFVRLRPYILRRREMMDSERVYEQFEWLCFELERVSPEARIPKDWQISEAASRIPRTVR